MLAQWNSGIAALGRFRALAHERNASEERDSTHLEQRFLHQKLEVLRDGATARFYRMEVMRPPALLTGKSKRGSISVRRARSSLVAVSGDRPRKAAKVLTCRT